MAPRPTPSPGFARALAVAATIALAAAAHSQPAATTDDEAAAAPPPATDLAALERTYKAEPDASRRLRLVQQISGLPGAADALARVVRGDPSDDVALAAAYILRRMTMTNVVGMLDGRLASGTRDPAARDRMLREIERHQVFAAGQSLPHFLREAPPPFTVKGAERRNVRVLAFGDFGDGSERQTRMAEAMNRFHAKTPFDFAVTLGDNFYPGGMTGPTDPRWERHFERLYGPMRIRFYPSLGNHDWVLADSPVAEILYSTQSRSWQMPADRYTFIAGPVQFFALDTNLVTRAQLEWLDRELGRSRAQWKIVYGHHPIYSYGWHGDSTTLRDALMPLLRKRANVYLCGHEHDLQHIAPEDGVHFVLAGGGGAAPRPIKPGPRSLYAGSKNGFAVIEATRSTLTVSLVDEGNQTLHKFALRE
jgi:tartrate-resistant acid phosphatase type 5